ncbi:MAG: hypothetical protein H6Q15_1180 [Bacteroidetes bacterium]|nr:hypothetical protein [Bacteroidota bacterium]
MSLINNIASKIINTLATPLIRKQEITLLALGKLLSNQQNSIDSDNINDFEFKIFSQRGEDGIIQYLVKNIYIKNNTFIEFGVENYLESNTRFLMMNNNWSGYVIDGSKKAMNNLKKREWFWAYDLRVKDAFIDKDNINSLMNETGFEEVGILSIDIDGNDYWIFEELDFSRLNPSIIIAEYNAVFGKERPISVPYDKKFYRTEAHYSNLYFGASLMSLNHIAQEKGYELVGCNDAGTNAFFVRKDLLNNIIKPISVSDAFREDKCRQSRDKNYNLSLLSGEDRLKIIKGMDVINVISMKKEEL